MSVRPIDIMMVPQMNEVSHIKQSENMRPATEQMNIVSNVDKKVENKSEHQGVHLSVYRALEGKIKVISLMLKKRAAMNMSEVEAVHIQSVLLRKAMLL